jgi:hypothetical protein
LPLRPEPDREEEVAYAESVAHLDELIPGNA